ncbi:ribonuclease H-like domain-containing protein [Hypoxylon rubiginosum]|uniref:Ribonuclease H-like domain-containing protein n=1 Tax=Hypoxylon rubiginosum TaxID=110542 RepID=A0ACC0CXJ5_9PEZI|nr:ribonuclease H-like domain-containing protein [Hypoxylon rubiginosum]
MSLFGNGLGEPYDEYGEQIRRQFDPLCSPMYRHVPKNQLVVYNPVKNVSQLQMRHPRTGVIEPDRLTVVLSIDGACRGNGTPTARAAWGVYFGPQSPHNASGLLDPTLPQTSSRAEIEALSQALRIIRTTISADYTMTRFRIRTDSEYLMKALSLWIEGWIENGGRRAQGKPVAHYQVLKDIHERLEDMEYGEDGGMDFKFWHVPREKNREADALANQALDGWAS